MAASVQKQVLVKGTITNELASKVELISSQIYSGFFELSGPNPIINAGHVTNFKHIGAPPQGTKGGVAYRVSNGDFCVLAWHVPQPGHLPVLLPNKVLGKDLKDRKSIDWEQIEKELDEQEPPESKVKTRYFAASITPEGSEAELFMNFLPIIPRDH